MLSRQVILLCLFALFVGIVAQNADQRGPNDGGEVDDDPDDEGGPPVANGKGRPSQNNGNGNLNRLPAGRLDVGNQQPAVNAPPVAPVAPPPPPPPPAPQQQASVVRQSVTPIASSPECKTDVQKYCNKGSNKVLPNLKVLQCIDDLDNAVNLINKDCQNLVYQFKLNMTHDARFDDAAQRQCSKDLKVLNECNDHLDERGSGRLVSCLYDRLDNITEPSCRYFINQLQVVVFNDWRLTEYFVDACRDDIQKFECGRLDDENEKIPHEQGAVISCLSQHQKELVMKCRKEIFRLAEMQSDDYHLDRALYYACRDDRERLCSQVPSGNGRVYRCLYDQKFNTMMSPACRKEVQRRQEMVVANVKMDVPFLRACRSEMIQHRCNVDPQEGDKESSLTKLLLCLEETLKKGEHIQDECRREMLVHRRMLMSDYALSPAIVSECKKEMTEHCSSLYQQGASGTIEQRGGRMIHCLLGAARREKSFSASCLTQIRSLVRAVDPGSDVRADPLLESTCRAVIDTLCPRVKAGDSNVILCLLDNLKNPQMTEDCEDRLMEVAYFMARDWRLTPRLLQECRTNLESFCQLPKDWSMNQELSDVQVGMFLGCLYQQRNNLERGCRGELKRLMHIRTQAIDLMPEIEQSCIHDLAPCRNVDVKGEEMKCLQKKYKKLEPQCRDAVRNFTQMTMSDPTLDFLLMKACEPMIQLFCVNIGKGNENDLIRCLVKHKNEQSMDFRCKAGIDHHQITSMKDEAFISEQFRRQCASEIQEHCLGKKTKAQVIQCLADLMLRDVLKKQNSIQEGCRDEIKFELLQRSESIDFDPILAKACRFDIQRFCANRAPGNAQVLDCLKENRNKVSPGCFQRLKGREKLDVVLPENDYSLMSKCASVIQKSCANEKKQNILSCLRRNINQDTMPQLCRRTLFHRLMVLNTDARFNKALIDNCEADIHKHCQDELVKMEDQDEKQIDPKDDEDDDDDDDKPKGENDDDNNDADSSDREMGGRIIQCLREKYAGSTATLESQCVTELVDVIQTSKIDVQLDVRLYQACKKYLTDECTGMEKEDCLKLRYQDNEIPEGDCKEQIRRIIREGRADVHIDRALSFACQADILKNCNDIPIGSGKQLQCLLSLGKSVTSQCLSMLQKRQELWKSVSNVEGVADVVHEIRKSGNSFYLFSIIMLILCAMFMAGCVCRPYARYSRVRKYK